MRTVGDQMENRLYNPALAERFYVKAAELDKDNTGSLFDLAELYEKDGISDGAIKTYKRILEIEPENTKARFKLVRVFMKQQDYDEARKQLDLLLDEEPGNIYARKNLADIAFLQQDYDLALNLYLETVNLAQGKEDWLLKDIYFAMARAWELKGNKENAIYYFRKRHDISRDNVNILLRLAFLTQETGRFDESEKYLDEAEDMKPGLEEIKALRERLKRMRYSNKKGTIGRSR